MNLFNIFLINLLIIVNNIRWINAQQGYGDICTTPNNLPGRCVRLPQCPYLIYIYGNNPGNNQVIRFLIGSQRNCGNIALGRDPIVCCNQPNYFAESTTDDYTEGPPAVPLTTTQKPPATTTTIATTTTTTTTPAPAPSTEGPGRSNFAESCLGPDLSPGECIELRECPSLLNRLVSSPSSQLTQFLRNSNAICNYKKVTVCCPIDPINLDELFGETTTTASPRTTTTIRPTVPELSSRLLTVEEGCGFSNATHTRIVGGEPAMIGAWPWLVLVGYTNNLGELSWRCGGTLITRRHVLTAAHCIKSTLTTIRAGEHDLNSPSETITYDVSVVKVARYESYDPVDGHNDLAILYLESDLPINNRIRPICIPFDQEMRNKDFLGYQPFVAGWGKTQEAGKSASILQEVQIPVLTNEICRDRYKKIGKLVSQKQFDNAVLCAGVLAGGKDSCQGDSGGPLMVPSITDEGRIIYYQIGIVSYGIGCARSDVPGVYTRVQSFVDWIQQKVQEPV